MKLVKTFAYGQNAAGAYGTYPGVGHLMSPHRLTPREREVLLLVKQGLSDKEIAEQCGISLWTVRTHIGNLYEKTGTHSRVEFVLLGGSDFYAQLVELQRLLDLDGEIGGTNLPQSR